MHFLRKLRRRPIRLLQPCQAPVRYANEVRPRLWTISVPSTRARASPGEWYAQCSSQGPLITRRTGSSIGQRFSCLNRRSRGRERCCSSMKYECLGACIAVGQSSACMSLNLRVSQLIETELHVPSHGDSLHIYVDRQEIYSCGDDRSLPPG